MKLSNIVVASGLTVLILMVSLDNALCAGRQERQMSDQSMLSKLIAKARANQWITAIEDGLGIRLFDFSLPGPKEVYHKPSPSDSHTSIRDVALAPDGSKAAFVLWTVGNRKRSACLTIVDLATGLADCLVETEDIGGPAWSPDGKQIAYSSSVERTGEGLREFGLFLLDVSTQRQKRLLSGGGYALTNQAWAPDGSQLVYAFSEKPESPPSIRIYDFRTQSSRELIRGSEIATWSPTGEGIAYLVPEADGTGMEMHLITPDGDHDKILLRDSGRFDQLMTPPIWSPDGEYLLYGRVYAKDPVGNVPYVFELATGQEEAVPLTMEGYGLRGYESWVQKR